MTPAIRTVSETDDVHVIEGLGFAFGGPFNGRDSYRTFASENTNFHWDLYPDSTDEPRFTRPLNYQHGFDGEVGLRRVGGFSPIRTDDRGVWVRGQLDKHDAYYAALRQLLDKDALAFSPESAEHAIRIDERTGEWLDWPVTALALTPTPSNPWNAIAARTADTIRIVEALRATNAEGEAVGPPEGGKTRADIPDEDFAGPDKSFPIVTPGSVSDAASSLGRAKGDREAIKAKIIAIAKRKGASFEAELPKAWTDSARSGIRSSSWDAAQAADILQDLFMLRGCEVGEDDQMAMLDAAIKSVQDFISAEMTEPEPDIEPGMMPAYMTAMRAGRRNSASDQAHVDAIHDHATALGATVHSGDATEGPDDNTPDEAPSDAARSGDAVPAIRIVEPVDPKAERARLDAIAEAVAADAFRAFTG